jgi:hypothetical protein
MPSTDPPTSSGALTPPGLRQGRRISGPRVLAVGLLIVLAVTAFVVVRIVQTSGPGPDPNTIPKRPGRAELPASPTDYVVPTHLVPVLADSMLRGVVLDGDRVVFEPGLIGWRLADEPDGWLVEHTWFYVPEIPVRLHTYAEMAALAERGAIGDTTAVAMVSYRWRMSAVSLEEARREAPLQIPKTPPEQVAEAVKPRPRGE